MSKTEGDPLGPGFAHRLRFELDRVRPRFSDPRYAAAPPRRVGAWRFAPVALVISVGGMIALTASVATGSTNPAVWTEKVVTTIRSEPASSPSPSPDDHPSAPAAAAPASHAPARTAAPPTQQAQPSNRPHDSESPEPRESPEPPGSPQASGPSPSPGDH